jgi:hypothetical protein
MDNFSLGMKKIQGLEEFGMAPFADINQVELF